MSLAPTDCWYAVAASTDVERAPLAVRALDRPVVLFRDPAGAAVALEDRCAHRAYPLSAGVLVEDGIRCGLCGFVYATDGQCVSVPTQPRVPLGAHVHAYPVRESDGLVWVFFGEPGRARLHRVPDLPWLRDPGWSTVADVVELAADPLLLLENFADVTQVPYVAPDISPTVLSAIPPPIEVTLTETTVTLRREFPPAPLPDWQADLLDSQEQFSTLQQGFFLSPAAWVDHWDVTAETGAIARLRFTQLVTPIAPGRSRLAWYVSRDFGGDDARVAAVFGHYWERVGAAMQTAQRALDLDGPGPEVNVSADAAALRVREIVESMLREEGVDVGRRRSTRPRRAKGKQ